MGFNILFTSAGRRVSLVGLFRDALAALGVAGDVLTADASGNAPAHFVSDGREIVPRVTDPAYGECLLEICLRRNVRLVVPLIDPELSILADRRDDFAEFGCAVLISSPEVVRIGSDKRITQAFFENHGFRTPRVLTSAALLDESQDNAQFPVIVKPALGSAGVGVHRVANQRQLRFHLEEDADCLVQELITGDEHTLDILVDGAGTARCVVPRLRIETRAGEVSKGKTVKNASILEAGKRLGELLPGAFGCITAQCFLTPSDEVVFIEINPRFGGGFPLAAAAGANFPRWIIEWMLDLPSTCEMEAWREDVVMLRYDAEIFTTAKAAG